MDTLDHILIVDDDAEIRSLLSQYLQKNGLRVTAVADGRAMWQAQHRDVLFRLGRFRRFHIHRHPECERRIRRLRISPASQKIDIANH